MKINHHVLIIVENLPVPFDKRVWAHAKILTENNYKVSIICPKGYGYNLSQEVIDGIHIYRHYSYSAKSNLGYILEYGLAFIFEFAMAIKIFFKNKFKVIQGCNPPDFIFLIALLFKPFGVKYIFDQHDLSPEILNQKLGTKKSLFHPIIYFLERYSYRFSDLVITVNESYKNIAVARGYINPAKVIVVRNAPNFNRFKNKKYNPAHKKGKENLVTYIGMIGEQDGVDLLIDIIYNIVNVKKMHELHFAIVGDGSELEKVKIYAEKLNVGSFITFYGLIKDDDLLSEILETSTLCVNTEKPIEENNHTTSIKVLEYMAFKKPIVQFDLKEGRFSAGPAALYAKNIDEFSENIFKLISNPSLRSEIGLLGYERIKGELSIECQSVKLIDAYKKVLK